MKDETVPRYEYKKVAEDLCSGSGHAFSCDVEGFLEEGWEIITAVAGKNIYKKDAQSITYIMRKERQSTTCFYR